MTGTQYGDQSSTKVILDTGSVSSSPYAEYVGKTVSVTSQVVINVTASYASYNISMINFYDNAPVTKVFS